MQTAIVTTLRNAEATLAYFVAYHLAIGFDHLFLFFDDPADPLYEQYADNPAITVVRHDETLRKQWRYTRAYAENYGYANREVMARQIMNAEVAVQMASVRGIDWLLHIDADELFYAPNESVKDHFADLTAQQADVAIYLNHEAIPETAHIDNFFTEVSLFKRNRATFNARQQELFQRVRRGKSPYFNFYDNGKSAAAVTSRTRLMGVHAFEYDTQPVSRPEGPFILHFPCCGLTHFLAKYKTLGQFGDKWFNRGDAIDTVAPVHSWSRDAVQTGDEPSIRQFYTDVFINRYAEVAGLFLQEDIFFRFSLPDMPALSTTKRPDLTCVLH